MCIGITSGLSSILSGKLADAEWVSEIKLQQAAFTIEGIATICIPLAKSFEALIAITLVMGVCNGVIACLIGPIAFRIVGPRDVSQAIGFYFGILSIPFTVGPPLAGKHECTPMTRITV